MSNGASGQEQLIPESGSPATQAAFKGKGGGLPCVVTTANAGEKLDIRVALPTDAVSELFGWTEVINLQSPPTRYDDRDRYPAIISTGYLPLVDLLDDGTYYHAGAVLEDPLFYRPGLARLSLAKGMDGIFCGTAHVIANRFFQSGKALDMTIDIRWFNYATIKPVDLDATVVLEDADRPEGWGDKRIVVFGTTGDTTGQQVVVSGGGQTLKTLNPGSACMYQLTNVTQDENQDNVLHWTEVTDEPYFLVGVNLSMEFLQRQAARLAPNKRSLDAELVASTTGMKQTWTIDPDAPAGTAEDDNKRLTVGGLNEGETFLITCEESDGLHDSKLVPFTSGLETYDLVGGNAQVGVSSAGIRVNHVASGGPDYTVETKIWLLCT